MATTKSSKKSTRPSTRKRLSERVNRRFVEDRPFFFRAIFSLAVIVVMSLFLFIAVMRERAQLTFPTDAGWTVFFGTLILAIWPAISTVKSKDWVRLAVISAVVIVMGITTVFWLRIAGMIGFSQGYWSIGASAWIVGFVMLLLPLVLNAWLLFRIDATTAANPEVEQLTTDKQTAETNLASAKADADNATTQHAEAVQTAKQSTTANDSARAELNKASLAYTEKEKEAKNLPEVKAQVAAQDALTVQNQALASTEESLETQSAQLAQLKTIKTQRQEALKKLPAKSSERAEAQRKLDAINEQIAEVESLHQEAMAQHVLSQSRIRNADAKLREATEKANEATTAFMRDATEARDKAQAKERESAKKRETAEADLNVRGAAVARTGKVVKKRQSKFDAANSNLSAARTAADSGAKSWLIRTIVLLVLSIVTYASWGGWAILG